ncbi:hypothetical protein LTR53_015309 [Teratosphaeriaceae sp. CCFEE 6253]|nr:hypothetical protein LTR53_015309 [Teratosphaeriaceae sp. CCFEE 6253]
MAAQYAPREPEAVAEKVLRRAQVSKMTRALQDRLALASVKIQHGWENMSLDAIEPHLDQRIVSRKRTASSNDTISDTASTTSSRIPSSLASSPLTAPMFSDDTSRSGPGSHNKRPRPTPTHRGASASSSAMRTTRRTRMSTRSASSWKHAHPLPDSSPTHHTAHARLPSTTNLSFISETAPTLPDSPPSPLHSEDDDADLPVHASLANLDPSTTRLPPLTSSPPHTPPPPDQRMRMRKSHTVSWSRTPKHGGGDDGADLLMFLAASPSPANKNPRHSGGISAAASASTTLPPPATPPCKPTPLPSSHMTPSTGFLGFGALPHTPGTGTNGNFNFADFVNVTPSPMQGPWATRTPNAGRTPAAAREARRRLVFEGAGMPGGSGGGGGSGRRSGGEGFGGEL